MLISFRISFRISLIAFICSLAHLSECQTLNDQSPNEVVSIDLRLNDNLSRHHTSQYKQINRLNSLNPIHPNQPSIVLRRGEQFDVVLEFKQPINETLDKIRLEFGIGLDPKLDKGTLFYFPVEINGNQSDKNSKLWGAKAIITDQLNLNVAINIPANAPVGIWRFKVSTKVAGTRNLKTFAIKSTIYIIFNAWSKDDDVYLAREDARNEYLINEVGKIYIGSYNRPTGRKWNYGQFHESVLPAVMYMLDQTHLEIQDRATAVKVSRAVSALVNSHDDNGLLVGNWSGNYGSGLAPWQWTGSAPIFEKYLQSGCRPVKYGQCWVFGGVTTTTLRTLGIPARTISNFVSAHDTDLSLTVDEFYSERGEKLTGVNGDSIWNFHVWSDAWMARNDLPPGYGGWQAIDATPQETSMGKYQLGPASLEAIKQGRVDFAYDVGFVYSEVNADLAKWRLDRGHLYKWAKSASTTNHVGRKILTKMIGVIDERSTYGVNDAENIANQYKYVEGSKEERQSFGEAVRSAGLAPILGGSGSL